MPALSGSNFIFITMPFYPTMPSTSFMNLEMFDNETIIFVFDSLKLK